MNAVAAPSLARPSQRATYLEGYGEREGRQLRESEVDMRALRVQCVRVCGLCGVRMRGRKGRQGAEAARELARGGGREHAQ